MHGDRLNMNAWKDIKQLISYSKGSILSKNIASGVKPDSTLFCMAKDSGLSQHTSKYAATIYVIEGRGLFILDGKRVPMRPGVIIFMDKNTLHSLKAYTDLSFILALY